MIHSKIDIEKQIESIYGFKVSPFQVSPNEPAPLTTHRQNGEIIRNIQGKPYYLPVTIAGQMIEHCVISVQNRKRIVDTTMVARRGSVKELISWEDVKITLNGFLISKNGNFPDREIDNIVKLYERNEALSFRSALTDYFLLADDKVVITSLDFPEMRGVTNVRLFKMDIVSDSIFDLNVD